MVEKNPTDKKEKMMGFAERGRPWARKTIERFLLPIIKRKVITETELMKNMPSCGRGYTSIQQVNLAYRSLKSVGFPIRRRTIDEIGPSVGSRCQRRRVNHRVVVYYLE